MLSNRREGETWGTHRLVTMGIAVWLAGANSMAWAQQVIRVGTLDGAQVFEPAIAAVDQVMGVRAVFVMPSPPKRSLQGVESGFIEAEMARVVGGMQGALTWRRSVPSPRYRSSPNSQAR